jgi:hypothetical protein
VFPVTSVRETRVLNKVAPTKCSKSTLIIGRLCITEYTSLLLLGRLVSLAECAGASPRIAECAGSRGCFTEISRRYKITPKSAHTRSNSATKSRRFIEGGTPTTKGASTLLLWLLLLLLVLLSEGSKTSLGLLLLTKGRPTAKDSGVWLSGSLLCILPKGIKASGTCRRGSTPKDSSLCRLISLRTESTCRRLGATESRSSCKCTG